TVMGVASHLGIRIDEYDVRIRTFIPAYDAMLDAAAGTIRRLAAPTPVVVDLGVGSGALAAACREALPDARLIGIDADAAMLELAAARLGSATGVELLLADFLQVELPRADAFVASLALHHVRDEAAKRAFYARCHGALRPGGLLVSADRFPALDAGARAGEREAWLGHLERSYGRPEAEGLLAAWAEEDVYVPLQEELTWLGDAGFAPTVAWRRDGFAVVAAEAA
ncbi:MAG TPA: class I SAM-dependent methyltransferase, partial [Gemmatimonadota bacterium]|nr:class I SAM-dependent methyltransferase [Gemmatimonadota bacterium]